MAHFIKLTETPPNPRHHYLNTQNISEFFGGIIGSYVLLMRKTEDEHDVYLVEETPEQILSLIAEAQGAK